MTIRQIKDSYEVGVFRSYALEGFKNIRRRVSTLGEANRLEAEILQAIETYGRWPVEEGTKPLPNAPIKVKTPRTQEGTLRIATQIALDTHWAGTRYWESVKWVAWKIVEYFESKDIYDIDAITSADIDAYVAQSRKATLAASTINKHLGIIRIVNDIALKRIPPLATLKIPTPNVKGDKFEKWWLRPEDKDRIVDWLRRVRGDDLFADYIEIMVHQGLRVEEALRLRPRSFTQLNTSEPWLNVPGTKTAGSQASIPVYPESLQIIKTAIQRAESNGWTFLFPMSTRQASARWNEVREFLGVMDIKTATLKSLRRTFAWYANNRGMPTATLQKVLRHSGIGTTAGYLELVGSGEVGQSREYFKPKDIEETTAAASSNIATLEAAIKAYRATGAAPEEVARFVKEMMN